MRSSVRYARLVAVAGLSVVAHAEELRSFAIPTGPLAAAIVTLGSQADVTIGLTDPSLAGVRVRRVTGRLSVVVALTRLLEGTPATFRRIDAVTYRIVRRRPAPRTIQPSAPITRPPVPQDIVVTASKRAIRLRDYPGSVTVVDTAGLRPASPGRGTATLVEQLPVLASTHLGPGRDKLFIRGVADSSFSGPTQATVGEYLGDVRLNYNAPDPDLALYDIDSVEVLEGPQGTLYGAGSLGGLLRLVPVETDLSRWSATLDAGVSGTAHGAPGADGAVVANAPIVAERLALRLVGYASVEGGYIDDPGRGLSDINRTTTRGGRASLRYQPSTDWTVELNGVRQDINSRDGQYAQAGLPPLERSSAIAQPFDNDYSLGSLGVRHRMGATTLSSSTSLVAHELTTTFDATGPAAAPIAYRQRERVTLLSNETRLSHEATGRGVSWVAGFELLHSDDRFTRALGPVDAQAPLVGTHNLIEEASVFGEATAPLAPRLSATLGGRLAATRVLGEPRDRSVGDEESEEPRRHAGALLPSIGLLWRARPAFQVYARYQEGYRPGGLSTDPEGTQRYGSDSLSTTEIGVRLHEPGDPVSASAAVSYAHWEDIQADLVGADGLPYIANIGSGTIISLEMQARWRPRAALLLQGGLFLNDSGLAKPAAAFRGERDASLPDIADVVASLGVRYGFAVAGRRAELSGSVHYVGRSRLGVGTALDLRQGRYADTAIGLSMPLDRFTLYADLTNVLDQRGNIFALGDPFGVEAGGQITPLRPRTLRLGVRVTF